MLTTFRGLTISQWALLIGVLLVSLSLRARVRKTRPVDRAAVARFLAIYAVVAIGLLAIAVVIVARVLR
jgi:glucan phosphoethanolaminetransferase (alkaline phosphatase superfamily)